MRRFPFLLVLLALTCAAPGASGAEGRLMKILPHFLDQEGRHARSPSLFERDAYQAYLRKNPLEISALRFDVQWRAAGVQADQLTLRVEARGGKTGLGRPEMLETSLKPGTFGSAWSAITLDQATYDRLGGVIAWRVTLWADGRLLAEQPSFLW